MHASNKTFATTTNSSDTPEQLNATTSQATQQHAIGIQQQQLPTNHHHHHPQQQLTAHHQHLINIQSAQQQQQQMLQAHPAAPNQQIMLPQQVASNPSGLTQIRIGGGHQLTVPQNQQQQQSQKVTINVGGGQTAQVQPMLAPQQQHPHSIKIILPHLQPPQPGVVASSNQFNQNQMVVTSPHPLQYQKQMTTPQTSDTLIQIPQQQKVQVSAPAPATNQLLQQQTHLFIQKQQQHQQQQQQLQQQPAGRPSQVVTLASLQGGNKVRIPEKNTSGSGQQLNNFMQQNHIAASSGSNTVAPAVHNTTVNLLTSQQQQQHSFGVRIDNGNPSSNGVILGGGVASHQPIKQTGQLQNQNHHHSQHHHLVVQNNPQQQQQQQMMIQPATGQKQPNHHHHQVVSIQQNGRVQQQQQQQLNTSSSSNHNHHLPIIATGQNLNRISIQQPRILQSSSQTTVKATPTVTLPPLQKPIMATGQASSSTIVIGHQQQKAPTPLVTALPESSQNSNSIVLTNNHHHQLHHHLQAPPQQQKPPQQPTQLKLVVASPQPAIEQPPKSTISIPSASASGGGAPITIQPENGYGAPNATGKPVAVIAQATPVVVAAPLEPVVLNKAQSSTKIVLNFGGASASISNAKHQQQQQQPTILNPIQPTGAPGVMKLHSSSQSDMEEGLGSEEEGEASSANLAKIDDDDPEEEDDDVDIELGDEDEEELEQHDVLLGNGDIDAGEDLDLDVDEDDMDQHDLVEDDDSLQSSEQSGQIRVRLAYGNHERQVNESREPVAAYYQNDQIINGKVKAGGAYASSNQIEGEIRDPTPVKRQRIGDSQSVDDSQQSQREEESHPGLHVQMEQDDVQQSSIVAAAAAIVVPETPPEPVEVENAKRNMMDHIVAQAARSAIRFNAQLRNQRKSFTRIFKLDSKKRAIDREGLSRSQYNFLYCGYRTGYHFINSLNQIKPRVPKYRKLMEEAEKQAKELQLKQQLMSNLPNNQINVAKGDQQTSDQMAAGAKRTHSYFVNQGQLSNHNQDPAVSLAKQHNADMQMTAPNLRRSGVHAGGSKAMSSMPSQFHSQSQLIRGQSNERNQQVFNYFLNQRASKGVAATTQQSSIGKTTQPQADRAASMAAQDPETSAAASSTLNPAISMPQQSSLPLAGGATEMMGQQSNEMADGGDNGEFRCKSCLRGPPLTKKYAKNQCQTCYKKEKKFQKEGQEMQNQYQAMNTYRMMYASHGNHDYGGHSGGSSLFLPPHAMLNGYGANPLGSTSNSNFFHLPSSGRHRINRGHSGSRTTSEFSVPRSYTGAASGERQNEPIVAEGNPFVRQSSTISNQMGSVKDTDDLVSNATPTWNRQPSCNNIDRLSMISNGAGGNGGAGSSPRNKLSGLKDLQSVNRLLDRAQSVEEDDLRRVEIEADDNLARTSSQQNHNLYTSQQKSREQD